MKKSLFELTVHRHEIHKYTVTVEADSVADAMENYDSGKWSQSEEVDCTYEEVTGIYEERC